MSRTKPQLEVLLDENGDIIEFSCNLPDVEIDSIDVIGLNWFETFISPSDKDKILEVFKDIIKNNQEKWKTYKNDVKFGNYGHKLIDFENEVIIIDGKKYLKSYGIEHMYNY